MSGNSGAWGLAMWRNGYSDPDLQDQEQGISLSGGDAIDPWLPTVPLGFLTLPPDGLGVPPVRSGDVAFAQRDGVVQFADYYEPRILTFQVDIPNEGCPGCPSARQAVSRLTQEWSRNCTGASLVIFSDCHDPDATEEERVYLGPYLVRGRPRAAEVTWRRSDVGGASVLLRFDAKDARMLLLDTIPGTLWDPLHTQTAEADEQNRAQDPTLSTRTMTLNGATVTDTHRTSGGPLGGDGGPWFERFFIAANTSSPMTMDAAGSGTAGIPVTAGTSYTVSWWAQKNPGGGPTTRVNMRWADAAGVTLSTTSGTNMSALADWSRHSQTFVAPVGAAFLTPILAWSGTALVGQSLGLAQLWINPGVVATEPETIEVVGTLCVYPTITLFPTMTAPVVVTYGNHEFTYTANVTSVVEIDTQYGRASTGVDVTANLTGDFSSPLEPGIHEVTVQTANPADTGFVTFQWENAVVSG